MIPPPPQILLELHCLLRSTTYHHCSYLCFHARGLVPVSHEAKIALEAPTKIFFQAWKIPDSVLHFNDEQMARLLQWSAVNCSLLIELQSGMHQSRYNCKQQILFNKTTFKSDLTELPPSTKQTWKLISRLPPSTKQFLMSSNKSSQFTFSETVILPPLQTWILLDFLHQQNNFWWPATNLLNSPSLKLWSYHHCKLESYWTSSINKTNSDSKQSSIHFLQNYDPTSPLQVI
jgi:hypothetical protein